MTTGTNFSDNAREVLTQARDHAIRLGHQYVAPEHIMLGLTSVGDSVAAMALINLGQSLEALHSEVVARIKPSQDVTPGPSLPYTAAANRVLELAMNAAGDMSLPFVGTEHILLGLVKEEKSAVAAVLALHQLTAAKLQAEIDRVRTTNRQSLALRRPKDVPGA